MISMAMHLHKQLPRNGYPSLFSEVYVSDCQARMELNECLTGEMAKKLLIQIRSTATNISERQQDTKSITLPAKADPKYVNPQYIVPGLLFLSLGARITLSYQELPGTLLIYTHHPDANQFSDKLVKAIYSTNFMDIMTRMLRD